ncbi:MAG: Ppx/GppA family phosphatase [Pseudomonadota bacterium]
MDVRRAAVIDIGSNSCRLVIYDVLGGAMLQSFNEKAMAGLGRGLSDTGQLSPEGRTMALDVCRRYAAILDSLGISEVYPVATAAVRVAEDGPAFVEEVESVLGTTVRVLTGADEGRISALGVSAGFGSVDGLVADLGGSSMELQYLKSGRVHGEGETHLLGPLARADDADLPLDKRKKAVRQILKTSELLPIKGRDLYGVGGGWRNVAAVHMDLTGYPLRVLHGYQMSIANVREVIDTADFARVDKATRSRLQRVAKRRYETLLHTAIVLEALMKVAKVERVTISAYGLREGVVSDAMGGEDESGTPLNDFLRLFLRPTFETKAYAAGLLQFCTPVAAALNISAQTVETACYLADTGARMHPDHRPNLVYEQVLRAPYPLLDHRERLFAAHACASRYTFKHAIPEDLKALRPEIEQKQARILGTAMRLAGVFSGRSASILARASLEIAETDVILNVTESDRDMVSGTVKRRLGQLAGLLERDAKIEMH